LDPDLQTDTTKSVAQSLSEKKGWSEQQTAEMIDYVRNMAKTVQLDYHFDKAVVANSFDAHRFSHYALKHGKQIEAEEKLFSAYFTEGKNIADHQTLAEIGASIGLDAKDVLQSLSAGANKEEVNNDLALARQFGITGVPFFVFDRKTAISGAQDTSVFLQALQKAAGH
jgi:predicted DsbA family dithiol-disulfide isomerase